MLGYYPRAVGYWIAVNKLGVLVLSEEVVLGVNLRVVEYLVRCVFDKYFKLAGVGCCWSC